jgi:cellulose synthase operon protein C
LQGFPALARQFLGELLRDPSTPEADKNPLRLELATALISLGEGELAREQLAQLDAGHPPVALRLALADYLRRDYAAAGARLSLFPPTALPEQDRSWYLLCEALLRQTRGESEAASQLFLMAEEEAGSAALEAHFRLLRLRGELEHRGASEDLVAQLRATARTMRGQVMGFESRRLLAIALYRLGRLEDAVGEVEALLQQSETVGNRRRDELLLLLGLMLGDQSGRGRLALRQLLLSPADPGLQRIALQLLTVGPFAGSSPDEFRSFLGQLLDAGERHPLFDELLVTRAALAARRGDFEAAEEDAERILEELPGSAFVPQALRLLAYTNWERTPPRYRTAANYLDRLRAYLPTPEERARVFGLMGDCYFLNGDFANASEAYASARRELGDAGLAGPWVYQQVLADIRANRLEEAAALLDRLDGLETAARWQAEYNLLDAYRAREQIETAFRRLRRLLGEGRVTRLEEPLQARLRWMEARLALDAGRVAEVPALADGLITWLAEEAEMAPAEKGAVVSYALLLKGEALIRLGLRGDGLAILADLRSRFPDSAPEMLSYLMESRLAAGENNVVEAQQSLVSLADRFPRSRYAPIALWEAALLAEQRGLDSAFREAMGLLDRLIRTFPGHRLAFYARIKQADLSRKLNDFGTALALYEAVLADYPDDPERYRAELSRGDCLLARGSSSAESLVAASVVFDRLFEDFRTPPDAAVEAGYKWATALRQRGLEAEAREALFVVKSRFFDDPERSIGLRTQGRYWIARTVLDLAALLEASGNLEGTEQAGRLYRQLLESRLPGRAIAEARLRVLRPEGGPSGEG